MYDKLKIWIDIMDIDGGCTNLINNLDEVHTSIGWHNGDTRTYGRLEGLKVSVYSSGVSIVGSLAKYLYPSNLYTLNRNTTKDAITKLSDALHIDMSESKVTSLEFGTHFIMKHPVEQYLNILGESSFLERIQYAQNTLYYRSKGIKPYKMHTFYDKVAESCLKGVLLPPCYADDNVLRYELRYNMRLPQQLKVNRVTGAALYDRVFYKSMISRYWDVYTSINKKQIFKTDIMNDIKTPLDAFELFASRILNKLDPNEIDDFVKELKDHGVFSDPKYYTRLKKKLLSLKNKAILTERSELRRELDNEVKNVTIYQ